MATGLLEDRVKRAIWAIAYPIIVLGGIVSIASCLAILSRYLIDDEARMALVAELRHWPPAIVASLIVLWAHVILHDTTRLLTWTIGCMAVATLIGATPALAPLAAAIARGFALGWPSSTRWAVAVLLVVAPLLPPLHPLWTYATLMLWADHLPAVLDYWRSFTAMSLAAVLVTAGVFLLNYFIGLFILVAFIWPLLRPSLHRLQRHLLRQ